MKTQIEQIKAAKRAYILDLNDPKDAIQTSRYAVYLDSGNGLEVLWPTNESDKKNLLLHQVYSKRDKYPAYHFALKGCGYSKTNEIRHDVLQKINPTIEVFTINGHSPSNC